MLKDVNFVKLILAINPIASEAFCEQQKHFKNIIYFQLTKHNYRFLSVIK